MAELGKRERYTLKVQLAMNNPGDVKLAMKAEELRKKRLLLPSVRQGLSLILALQSGDTATLMHMFPGIYSELSGIPLAKVMETVNQFQKTEVEQGDRSVPDVGYVYLLRIETNPPNYKIGASKNPESRIHQVVGTEPPFDYKLIHKIPTASMFKLESRLQKQFAGRRVRGEWFALTDAQVEEIKAMR